MAITRIKNNQITDSTIDASVKVLDNSLTGGKLELDMLYPSNLTIGGDLTVNGDTTIIETENLVVEDPLILLAAGQTGVPSQDIGILGERGSQQTIAFVWNETSKEFIAGYTNATDSNTNVTIDSTVDLHVNNLVTDGNVSIVDLALTGNLTVGGTTDLTGLLTAGDIDSATLDTTGAVTVGDTLGVTGATTMTGALTANGGVTASTLESTGNTTVGGDLSVTGVSSVGALNAGATTTTTLGSTDITASGDLDVSGSTTLVALTTNDSVIFNDGDGSSFTSNIPAQLNSTLDVSGDTSLATMSTTGLADLASLDVQGSATVGTTLEVTGATTLQSNFTMSGGTGETFIITDGAGTPTTLFSVDANNGNTNIAGTLGAGTTTVTGDLTVTGTSNIGDISGGDVTVNSLTSTTFVNTDTLNATGAVDFDTTLNVDGLATLASASVTGAAAVGGNLTVTGTSDFTGTMTTGNVQVGNAITVTGATTTNGALTANGVVDLNGDTTIANTEWDIGATIDANTNAIIDVADPTNPQDAATKAYVDSLSAAGWDLTDGTTTETVKGGDTVTFNGTTNEVEVIVSSVDTVTVGLPDSVTITTGLTTGDVSTGTLSASGASTLAAVSATNITASGTLGVTGATTLAGVTAGSTSVTTLASSGLATLNSLNVTTNSTLNGTLTVVGDTQVSTMTATGAVGMASTLNVTGATTLAGTLGVTGSTSVSTITSTGLGDFASLEVQGTSTLNSTLEVLGNATLHTNVTINGGAGEALTINDGGTHTPVVATALTPGREYEITTNTGGTTWTTLGAADNNIGTVFTYNGSPASGTDTATPTADIVTFSVQSDSGDSYVAGDLTVDGSVNFNTGTFTHIDTGTITSTGLADFDSLEVTQDSQLNTLSTSGTATLNNATVTNALTASSTLQVNGQADFADNVKMTGPGTTFIIDSGSGTTFGIGADTGNTIIPTGTLTVSAGNTSLATLSTTALATLHSLDVTNATQLLGGVDVTGQTETDTLLVNTTSTLTGDTATGNINTTGVNTITGSLVVDETTIDGSNWSSTANAINIDPNSGGDAETGVVNILGDLNVTGTTTTFKSETLSVTDPIIELGSAGNADSLDRGVVVLYNDGTDPTGTLNGSFVIGNEYIIADLGTATQTEWIAASDATGINGVLTEPVRVGDRFKALTNGSEMTGTTSLVRDRSSGVGGFFGYDNGAAVAGEFVWIPDGTETAGAISGDLGPAAFGSLRVTDLTETRIPYVAANGELVDSANLTFDGTNLTVPGLTNSGDLQVDGNFGVTGTSTLTGALTANGGTTTTTMDATGNATIGGTATVTGALTAVDAFVVGGTSTMTGLVTANGGVSTSTVDTTGDVTIGGDLDVSGATTTLGTLTAQATTLDSVSVTNNATVGGTMGVTGNTTLTTVTASGTATMAGVNATNITASGTLGVTGNSALATVTASDIDAATVDTTGAVTVGTTLGVTGNTSLSTVSTSGLATLDSVGVTNNATVSGLLQANGGATATTLTTTGLATLNSASVTTNASVGGTLDVTGDTTLNNNVTLSGGAGEQFIITDGTNPTVTVDTATGNTVIEGSLTVNGATDLGDIVVTDLELDTLTVNTSITNNGTLDVTGVSTLAGALAANGGITVDTDKFVVEDETGNTSIGGWLGVTGETWFDDDVHVNSPATFYVGTKATPEFSVDSVGNIATSGTIDITGTSNFTGNMTAGTISSSSITTTGNATVGGALDVTGNAVLNADVTLAGGAGEQFLITDDAGGNIMFSVDSTTGNTVVEGDLTVNGDTNFGNIGAGDLNVNSLTSATFVDTATLAVSSTSVFTGAVTANGGVTATTVATSGNTTVGGTMGVTGNTTLTTVTTSGLATLASASVTGAAAVGGNLGVSGDTVLATAKISDLTSGRVVLAGTAGELEDSANLTFDGVTLTVTGTAAITANATVGGTLGVTGETTMASATVSDLSPNGIVIAGVAGSLGTDPLLTFVGGALTVTGTAAITGNTTVGGTLGVTGLSTLDSVSVTNDAAITGNTTVGGTLGVTGLSTLDSLTVTNASTLGGVVIESNHITVTGGATELVINEAGADLDFRVEGDTDENLLFVNAGDDTVNIGTPTSVTGAKLNVNTTDSVMLAKGTTAERPAVGIAGMLRYNTSTNNYEFFDGGTAEWAEFGVEFTVIASETFNGDGTTTAFSLATPQTTASCIVSINGTVQHPVTAYGVSGTVLTFTEAPAVGDVIEVREITTTTTLVGLNNGTNTAVVETLIGQAVVEITGDLNPITDSVYDLGSATKKWKDLHLSGTTLYLNDIQIQNQGGTFKFLQSDGTTPAPIDGAITGDIDGGTF